MLNLKLLYLDVADHDLVDESSTSGSDSEEELSDSNSSLDNGYPLS